MMSGRRSTVWKSGATAIVLLSMIQCGLAQTSSPPAGPTLEDLQTRLKQSQSETELEPQLKQEVIDTYQAAIERLEIASEAAATAESFHQRLGSVPEQLQLAQQALALLPEQLVEQIAPDEAIDSLERRWTERRAQIDEPERGLRASVEALTKTLSARKSRVEEIARDLMEIDERMESIQELMDAPIPEGQPRELTNAIQALLQVRRMRANEERAALRAEQAWCESNDVNVMLRAQRDLAARELSLAEAEAQRLREAIDHLRGNEADNRIHDAEQVVARAAGDLKPIAEFNLELAKESRDVAVALGATNEQVDSTQKRLNALRAEFDQSRTMVEAVGLTESIGLLLRQQRSRLGDTHSLAARLATRSETVRQTRMRLFQIEADIAALQDLEAAANVFAIEMTSEEVAARTPSTTPGTTISPANPPPATGTADPNAEAIKRLAADVTPLLELRRDLLERLDRDYGAQFEKLVLLDNDERKLLDATQKYAAYIDERVLWIRTGSVFGASQTSHAVKNSLWLVDDANWKKVVDALQVDFDRQPLPYLLALTGLLVWMIMRWTLHRRLQVLGEAAADPTCRVLFPTLQALVITVLLGAFIPAALGFLSWRLDHSTSTSRFVHAIATGLWRATMFAAAVELLRMTTLRGGLAEKHFEWSATTLVRLRRHLYWFVPAGITLIAIVGMVEANSNEQRLDSLGRVCYLSFTGLLGLFCYRAFPRTQVSMPAPTASPPMNSQEARRAEATPSEDDVWMDRLVRFGRVLAVAIPLGLMALCWSGYFYTALQLTWRLQASVWLVLGLVLLRGTVRRWITLERRRMAVLQAEEMQAIVGAGRHPGSDTHSPFLFPRWTWPDFRLNLSQIVTQVRSLLDTGLLTVATIVLWFVWADVTPALNIFDRVTLWQTTVEEVVESKGADDKPVVQIVKRPKPITASNIGLAVIIMGIAMIAGRNIPGLVEVILLEHLSVDAGARFATTCLVRYVIFTSGIVLAFNEIGIGWNSVQWLVAAASVGLGFGLQEIFANFVSGIILLFERPMRVGDVITIGTTTGTVSRIRFRATTIVDGDRKELIVPNKSFITGNLLNWTLSDSVNRVAVKVGVAYGSDPNQVRKLLLEIAAEHPCLLKDPEPTAMLVDLGDSALNFQLGAFLPSLKDRQNATHELNAMIYERFRAAGIEIPFPQQDVHIHSAEQANSESKSVPRDSVHESNHRTRAIA